MIPDEIIEQVRDSVDLIALIGETVDLKKSGGDWRGPCPFHGGRHRNFAVIPKKGRYYCFVCKESGDAFSWYMKHFGMDYPGAVRFKFSPEIPGSFLNRQRQFRSHEIARTEPLRQLVQQPSRLDQQHIRRFANLSDL